MLSQRRFGVEIECGHPGGPDAVRDLLTKEKIKPLSVGSDGSGVEVRSPILQGTKGLEWLKECMQAIREDKGYVTTADGMHVHHEGIPGYRKTTPVQRRAALRLGRVVTENPLSTVACLRLINSWKNNDELLDQFVAARRRNNTNYCSKVWRNDEHVKAVKEGKFPGKYSDLNLSPLKNSKGTIEIRLHEGTLDFEEAEAWIRLCQSLLDTAVKSRRPIPKQKNIEALLNLLIESDDIKLRLVEKAKRDGKPSPNSAFKVRSGGSGW